MFKILIGLIFSLSVLAQNQVVPGDIFPDADSNKNFIKNPMSLQNLIGVTATTHSLSRNTSSPIMGSADFQITAGAAGNVAWALKSHENFLTGQNCEFKGLYNGGGNTWTADIYDGTNILNSISLPAVTQVTPFNVVFPCGSGSPTRTVRFVTTASASQLNVDKLYYGVVTSIGQFSAISEPINAGPMTIGAVTTPPTKATSPDTDRVTWYRVGKYAHITYRYYQANITGAAAGSGEYLYSLPSGLVADTSLVTAFTGAGLPEGKKAIIGDDGQISSASGPTNASVYPVLYNNTQFRLYTYTYYTGGNYQSSTFYNKNQASYGFSFTVVVPIQGWSASQSAAAANQTDYGWTAYTPTFTGFGTVTSPNCFHRRTKENLDIRCRFTAGTVTATEARVSLPNSLVSSSGYVTLEKAGSIDRNTGFAAGYFYPTVLIEPSVSYFTFGAQGSGTAALVKRNASDIFANSEVLSFFASVQIQGWAENQRAPTLIGSVTADGTSAFRLGSANISPTGVVTEIMGGDWINGNCVVTSTSVYTCALNSGFSTISCQVSVLEATGGLGAHMSSQSISSVVYRTQLTPSGNASAEDATLFCSGAR